MRDKRTGKGMDEVYNNSCHVALVSQYVHLYIIMFIMIAYFQPYKSRTLMPSEFGEG